MKSLSFFRNHATALSFSEMKKIGGGACGVRTASGTVYCDLSKSEALFMVSGGGNWCCSSCGTSSYCGSGGPQT